MGGGEKQAESRDTFLEAENEDKRRTFSGPFADQAAWGAERGSPLKEAATASRDKLIHIDMA